MLIERISYSRTKNINSSDAECIEISALVDPKDENEQDAILEFLRAWVEEKMQIRDRTAKLYARKNQLQREIHSLEDEVQDAKNKVAKVNEFMEKLGLSKLDEIPF